MNDDNTTPLPQPAPNPNAPALFGFLNPNELKRAILVGLGQASLWGLAINVGIALFDNISTIYIGDYSMQITLAGTMIAAWLRTLAVAKAKMQIGQKVDLTRLLELDE